jgi:hypothetical protein
MSRQKHTIAIFSVVALAAITAETFVSPTGGVAAAAGNALGVAESDTASGGMIPVITHGTAIVTAGGAIAAGGLIEVGASGKAVAKAAGVTVARCAPWNSAAADGDKIEVFLINN